MQVVLTFRYHDSAEDGYDVKIFESENDLQQWLLPRKDVINMKTVLCWTHCQEAHYIPYLMVKGET